MRQKLLIAAVLMSLLPITGQSETNVPVSETYYPYIVGGSAVAGMVITQAVLFGSAGFPFFGNSVAPGAAIAPEISVGISRMFAISSAVAGGLIADWFYDHQTEDTP